MGIDYEAKAGYGVRIKNNLTEKGQQLRDKYGDVYAFIRAEFGEFSYDIIGCEYSGDTEIILCSEMSDVVKHRDKFEIFKSKILLYRDLLINIEPKWYCELYIY